MKSIPAERQHRRRFEEDSAMIYADQRWIGPHGIGRSARHVLAGLDCRTVLLTSHPALPLDAWRLADSLLLAGAFPNTLRFIQKLCER